VYDHAIPWSACEHIAQSQTDRQTDTQTEKDVCLVTDTQTDREFCTVQITVLRVACGMLLPFPPDPLPPLVLRLLMDGEASNALLGCTFKKYAKEEKEDVFFGTFFGLKCSQGVLWMPLCPVMYAACFGVCMCCRVPLLLQTLSRQPLSVNTHRVRWQPCS